MPEGERTVFGGLGGAIGGSLLGIGAGVATGITGGAALPFLAGTTILGGTAGAIGGNVADSAARGAACTCEISASIGPPAKKADTIGGWILENCVCGAKAK